MDSASSAVKLTSLVLGSLLVACSERPAPVRAPAPAPVPAKAPAGGFERPREGLLPAVLAPSRTCNLEFVDGQPWAQAPVALEAGRETRITGWVVDADSGRVPADVFLRAQKGSDSWVLPVSPTLPRDDVVAHLGGNTGFRLSGFEARLRPEGMPGGEYRVHLVYFLEGRASVCDNGRTLIIR
jgi:hypothetical protein